MNERANLLVSLPRPNPTISYWQDPPHPTLADHGSSEPLPTATDTLIIGSGITGASVAWNLLQEPDHGRVTIVEARQACSGATGRNGGHTKAASYRSFLTNVSTLGLQEAVKIVKLELANIRAVHAFARSHGLACDSWTGDTVDVFYDAAEWDRAKRAISAMQEAMPDEVETGVARYRFWTAEEVAGQFHCESEGEKHPRPLGAVTYEAGSLSAYAFVTGVLGMCLSRGADLFAHTPVTSISSRNGAWSVETARGAIIAKRVMLATNAYTAFLRDEFRGSVIPLRGQITAQRPGRSMPSEGLRYTYSFVYDGGYDYMIFRPPGSRHAGDVVIGGGFNRASVEETGNTDDETLNPDISEYLTASAAGYFGSANWGADHEDGRVRREWSGIMGYSPDGFPFVGEVPDAEGLWVCAGFQGHGMVTCWMCAKAVTEMMVGRRNGLQEWFPLNWEVSAERLKTSAGEGLYVKNINHDDKI